MKKYSMPTEVTDLSQMLTNGMPVFPGTEAVLLQGNADIESKGYNEIRMHISTHTGTHLDCGLHLIQGGFNTGNTPPDKFFGRGMVIDCRHFRPGEVIPMSWLKLFEKRIKEVEFVLFHTGWSRFWGDPQYFIDFPVPDIKSATYLSQFPLKGAGIDAPSFDPVNSELLPVHIGLLSKGIVLIENLTHLDQLPDDFIFCCFPLKVEHGDGSPVRAVGINQIVNRKL